MMSWNRRQFIKKLALGVGGGVLGYPLLSRAAFAQRADESRELLRDRGAWRLKIGGDVGRPCLFDLENIWMLPSRLVTARLTAESGQTSVAAFEGVHISTFATLATAHRRAQWVHITCEDGHEDWFALGDLMRPQAIFVHTREDVSPMPEWGGVLRLIVPWRTTNRHPSVISRIDFAMELPGGVDPFVGAMNPRTTPLMRGYRAVANADWSAASRRVEIPTQHPEEMVEEAWFEWTTPWGTPDPSVIDWYASMLVNTSFVLANMARTNLVKMGRPGVEVLSPSRDWTPDTNPLQSAHEDTRLIAHNLLAEVDDAEAADLTRAGLRDASSRVRAMCLDTLIRREAEEALALALNMAGDGDEGVALTAIDGVRRLAPQGDAEARNRLTTLREATRDPLRVVALDAAVQQLTGE